MIHFPKFFPKQFSRKFFPELSQKIFCGKRTKRQVRDFPKMPHRIFRDNSCILTQPHKADPESKLDQPAPFSTFT